MACNFRIFSSRRRDSTQLSLEGYFDGSSAQQLLYAMRSHCTEAGRIVVHTEKLTGLNPFGMNVFRYNLGALKKDAGKFAFTGKYAEYMAEAWPKPLRPVCAVREPYVNGVHLPGVAGCSNTSW